MSSDDPQKVKANTFRNPVVLVTFIGAIAIILAALIASFNRPLGKMFLNKPTAASELALTGLPVAAPVVDIDVPAVTETALSPASQTIDKYFRYINNAENSDKLSKAWELLTLHMKCNPGDRCNFARYQDFWWQSKVQYKLYDCGSNTIDTELTYYARKTPGPQPSAQKDFIRYKLIEENGQLKLDSGEGIEAIGANCQLAVSVP